MNKTRKRRYPKALTRLVGEGGLGQGGSGTSQQRGPVTPELPLYFGAPAVRRGIAVSREDTENPAGEHTAMDATAKQVFFAENPDGTQGFQVQIKDDLFDNLRCAINVLEDGKVQALFYVQDENLRRLLDAESGRLRVRLEEKGLRVSEVRVIMASGE